MRRQKKCSFLLVFCGNATCDAQKGSRRRSAGHAWSHWSLLASHLASSDMFEIYKEFKIQLKVGGRTIIRVFFKGLPNLGSSLTFSKQDGDMGSFERGKRGIRRIGDFPKSDHSITTKLGAKKPCVASCCGRLRSPATRTTSDASRSRLLLGVGVNLYKLSSHKV